MTSVAMKIKDKMRDTNFSVHSLEKKAGLKTGAIQNILYGRSKNPSVNTMQQIAQALNCSVIDLIGDPEGISPTKITWLNKPTARVADPVQPWNQDLYLTCFNAVHQLINESNASFKKETILTIIDEVLNYSMTNELEQPDFTFARYLIKKFSHEY